MKTFSILACVVGSLASLTLGAHRADAQRRTTVAAEATIGGGSGKGGEFKDRELINARVGIGVRHWRTPRLGTFAELSMDWLGVGMGHHLVCVTNPRGGCLGNYPELAGPTVVVGIVGRRSDGRFEMRAGVGGGAYAADGPRVGAAVTQLDAAVFPITRVGLIVGARWVVIPRYRGDRLSVLPWSIGLRFR